MMTEKKQYLVKKEIQTEPTTPDAIQQFSRVLRGTCKGEISSVTAGGRSKMYRSYYERLTEKEATMLRLQGAVVQESIHADVRDYQITVFKYRYTHEKST